MSCPHDHDHPDTFEIEHSERHVHEEIRMEQLDARVEKLEGKVDLLVELVGLLVQRHHTHAPASKSKARR